ncbi:MAG: hypothetical protein ACYCZN_08315 [Candidatus Dormibacteria bacterium]
MARIRFGDPQDREDVIALGLPAGRLGLVGAGLGATLEALHLPVAAPVRILLAALLLANTAGLVWMRFAGLSLAAWAGRALRFGWRLSAGPRRQEGVWMAADRDGTSRR